jgi:acyl-CoA thioesterase II
VSLAVCIGLSHSLLLRRVDPVRDGRSFKTRSVKAMQAGQTIFMASASFHKHENSVCHSYPMPPVPPPEELSSSGEHLKRLLDDSRLTERQRKLVQVWLQQPVPLDIRVVGAAEDPFDDSPKEPRQLAWIRARLPGDMLHVTGTPGELSQGPELSSYMHRCIAAFISDWTLCITSLRPHGLSLLSPRLKMLTSIDHSIWFHRPFDATQWMLYETESPVARGGRSLNLGRLFDREGNLCMSVAQEALIRT